MSSISSYLSKYDQNKAEATKIAEREASRLESKDLKLIELIEALGDYINSDESSDRIKAASYLADVIGAVPPRVFSLQQRNLLCDFVLSRIADDSEGISHNVRTLLALEDRGQWDRGRAATTMKSVLEQTHPLRQYKSQVDRFTILTLIDRLLLKYRDAIRDLIEASGPLMLSLATYFEGEKDPRNLMLVFSNLQIPMTEWDISPATQDFFNAVFDYFPITFTPPPNDPYGITPEQLKDRLRRCIASTDALAPFAVPALLDKLDSTSPKTKSESLEALRECVKVYGPRTLSRYSVTIWDALKYEVWNIEDEPIAESVLQTFRAMATRLSNGTDYLHIFLSPIAKECREHLEDIPTKQSKASETVVASLTRASPIAFEYLAPPLINYLLHELEKADDANTSHGVLEVLVQIARSSIAAFGEWSQYSQIEIDKDILMDQKELKWKDELFSRFMLIITSDTSYNVAMRVLAFDGLKCLCKVKHLLKDQAIIRVLELSCGIAINIKPVENPDVRKASVSLLKVLSDQKPQLIINKAIPLLIAKLFVQEVNIDDCREEVLEVLAKIGSVAEVRTTVVIRLKNHLIEAIQNDAQNEYMEVVVAALFYAVASSQDGNLNRNNKLTYDDIPCPILLRLFDTKSGKLKIKSAGSLLDGLGRISNILIREESLESQMKLVPQVYKLHRSLPQDESSPFGIKFEGKDNDLMILSTYLLASFRREIQLPFDLTKLLSALTDICLEKSVTASVRSVLHLQISLLVNKYLSQPEVDSAVDHILSTRKLLEKHDVHSTRVVFVLAKGLFLRGHRCAYRIISNLLERLVNPDEGLLAAQGFKTLLHSAEVMSERNHFVLRLGLHKQRLFNMVLSVTLQWLKNSADPSAAQEQQDAINGRSDVNQKLAIKRNHLLALAGITRSVNYHYVIEPELNTFFPVLLQSLDFTTDNYIRITATDTLLAAIMQSPHTVEDHVSGVLARLLNIATASASSPPINTTSMNTNTNTNLPLPAVVSSSSSAPTTNNLPKLRASALQCLSLMPTNLRNDALIPFRRNVTKKLVTALDDRKRSVRMEAVRCKARWVEMDEPDDD